VLHFRENKKHNYHFLIHFSLCKFFKNILNHREHRGASRYIEKPIFTKRLWSLPLCSLCLLWLEKRSLIHKEDKRRCALEENKKHNYHFLILFSFTSLCVKNIEPQRTPRRFALHRETTINKEILVSSSVLSVSSVVRKRSLIHKEGKRRCALEETKNIIITSSFSSHSLLFVKIFSALKYLLHASPTNNTVQLTAQTSALSFR